MTPKDKLTRDVKPTAKPRSTRHRSVWEATSPMPDRPALAEDLRAEVCIVGAGIAG